MLASLVPEDLSISLFMTPEAKGGEAWDGGDRCWQEQGRIPDF